MSSSSQTQVFSHQSNGVTFVDPKNPDFSVRFKTTVNPKMLDGVRTSNYVTEIILNDLNRVSDSSNKLMNDPVSVRLRVSGSLMSHERMQELIKILTTHVGDWAQESVLLGFEPKTAPTNVGERIAG